MGIFGERRVQLTCKQCGVSFSTPKSKADKGAKYCGSDCFEKSRQKRVHCKCEVCGEGFELRPSDISQGEGKFCSWACYNRFRTKRLTIACQECGKKFESYPSELEIGKGKYCSKACANRATGRERRRELETFVCEHCGKQFNAKQTPAQIAAGDRKFCSRECFAQTRLNRIEKACEFCGKKISLTPAQIELGQGRYCSKNCKDKANQKRVSFNCITCGKRFELEESRVAEGRGRFCSKSCSLRYRGETLIEQLIREELERRHEFFDSQVKFKRYHVDFVLPLRKAVIECDGRYWHNKLDVFARDRRKDEYLRQLGYRVFRFTDQEIQKSANKCLNQVLASAPMVLSIDE